MPACFPAPPGQSAPAAPSSTATTGGRRSPGTSCIYTGYIPGKYSATPLWQTPGAAPVTRRNRRIARMPSRRSSATAAPAAAAYEAMARQVHRGHISSPAPRRWSSPPDAGAHFLPPDASLPERQGASPPATSPSQRPSARQARCRVRAGAEPRPQSRGPDNSEQDV